MPVFNPADKPALPSLTLFSTAARHIAHCAHDSATVNTRTPRVRKKARGKTLRLHLLIILLIYKTPRSNRNNAAGSTARLTLKAVVRTYHQINDHSGYGYVQPDGISELYYLFVPGNLVLQSIVQGHKYQRHYHRSQQYVRQ